MTHKIIDEFLSLDDYNIIMEKIPDLSWIRQKSYPNDMTSDFLMSDVTDQDFFNKHLYEKVASTLDKDVKLQRVYFNGQYWCRDGNIHRDGCDITGLIYITPYAPGLGGFTEMWDGDNHHIIPPYQGRLLLFPGHWEHKGYPYSKQDTPMRISLAYKMYLC